MTDTARSFRTGTEAAKEGTAFALSRAGFFKLKEDERVFVQFITEPGEWQTVDMHPQVPTKPKPADYEGNWPKYVNPVCRRTKMGDDLPLYDDCYVCEHLKGQDGKPFKRQSRIWAIGVLREEVLGDGTEGRMGGPSKRGQRVGFKNRTVEFLVLDAEGRPLRGDDDKPTGEKVIRPEVVIFTMAWTNFFAALQGHAAALGGTIGNVVFDIRRTGGGLDTDYPSTPVGFNQQQDFNTPASLERIGIKLDPDHTDENGHHLKIYPYEYNLHRMLDYRSSAEFYGRFIDPRVETPSGKKADPKPSVDVEPDAMKNMRERIMSWSESDGSETSQAPAEAQSSVQEDFDAAEAGAPSSDFDEA